MAFTEDSDKKSKLLERDLCGFNVTRKNRNIDVMYMFVSQHQLLQIAGNKLIMFFFLKKLLIC